MIIISKLVSAKLRNSTKWLILKVIIKIFLLLNKRGFIGNLPLPLVLFLKTWLYFNLLNNKFHKTYIDRIETETDDGDILSLYFRIDKVSDTYERKIFSLGELLGLAGGFYGALLTIGSFFLSVFSDKLFIGAVLRRIYQIENKDDELDCKQRLKTNEK